MLGYRIRTCGVAVLGVRADPVDLDLVMTF